MENVQVGKERRMRENLKLLARAGTKAAVTVNRGLPLKEKLTLCNWDSSHCVLGHFTL